MRRPLLAALAACAVVLVGCSEQTQGSPLPGGESAGTTTTTTEQPESSDPPTSSTEAEGGLAGVEPCDLVDGAGLASLGLTGGEAKSIGGARVCRWRHDGATLNESFTVSVELFDTQGLDDLAQARTVQELPKVGGHDAVSFTDPTGGCGVSLGVGDSSRVDNTAVGGDQQQGCRLAAQLAALVEPKLP